MSKRRIQLNVKLDSEESQDLVERLKQEAAAKGWTLRDALLDAVKQWLTNPPTAPPTAEGILPEILNRLNVLEASQPDITAIINAVLEQLQSIMPTHVSRQDIDDVKTRVNQLQQFTRQELAARDRRLDAIRDALSVIQAKIVEIQDGQATLAIAIASTADDGREDTQPAIHTTTQNEKASKTPSTQASKDKGSQGTHVDTSLSTQNEDTQVDTPIPTQDKTVSKIFSSKTSKGKGTHAGTLQTTRKKKDSDLEVNKSREAVTCKHCGAIAIHKLYGSRKNKKTGEVIQRYQCVECGKSFYEESDANRRCQPNEPLTYEEIKNATDEEVRRMSISNQWQAVCDDPSDYPNWEETAKDFLNKVQWNERNK